MRKPPQGDPIRALQREAVAARRFPEGARCACGEARPLALIPGSTPIVCAECQRRRQGRSIIDMHHVAGRANSTVRIPAPVNDHRADLSAPQYDWPKETLENPNADDLLKIAASIRGFIDAQHYLLNRLLQPLPEILETHTKQKRRKRNKK